jgi:transaldolase/glucose-6-phosphate isomerase
MSIASPASKSEPITRSLPREFRKAVAEAHHNWDRARNIERLWAGKHGFPPADLVETQLQDLSRLKAFSAEVKEDGFSHLVLLATDGSAIAAEALHLASPKQNGSLGWFVLNTADPSDLRELEDRINPARTLFCTFRHKQPAPGTDLLASYFFEKTRQVTGDQARLHFLAISAQNAAAAPPDAEVQYRHVYSPETEGSGALNPFSDFGLAPLAAAGHGVEKLLKGASAMARLCREEDSHRNPGVALGLLLAAAAAHSRDKLTLICSPSCRAFGDWIAYLLASHRLPLIPVVGEPAVSADTYAPDRLFICLRFAHEMDREMEEHISLLEDTGHPVVRLTIEDTADLGQTIFQWQIAAAAAAMSLNHNPSQTLEAASESPVVERELVTQGDIKLLADAAYASLILRNGDSAGALLRRHLDGLNPGDLFGVAAFVSDRPEHREILQTIRKAVLQCKQAATVVGFGPGFLAGPGSVLIDGTTPAAVLFITSERCESHSRFAEVVSMQARNDFHGLAQSGRPVIHVHLGSDVTRALKQLRDLICAAVEH